MDDTLQVLNQCKGLADQALADPAATYSVDEMALYLAHTNRGATIRSLASATGAHPSTVLRTIRKIESRRDDPLVDQVFVDLEDRAAEPRSNLVAGPPPPRARSLSPKTRSEGLRKAAKRYLRRMSEPEAFLLIADDAPHGGIFCAANQHEKPIAMMEAALAAEFMRNDWIRVKRRGSLSTRYVITEVGRSHLRRVLAEDQKLRPRQTGFAEARSVFQRQHKLEASRLFSNAETDEPLRVSVNLGESPVGWLSRRRGSDGKPFLNAEEVEAAERLRADFESAQMGPSVAQNWRGFLTPGDKLAGTPIHTGPAEGPTAARRRVSTALSHLGPGLSDVAIRVCCFLEGLEACEKRLGWSARSGKVVLKIALQRLAEHYGLIAFKH